MNDKFNSRVSLSESVFVFAVCFAGFGLLIDSTIDNNPIVADGLENLTVARNILRHGVFSSVATYAPSPDMFREPAWPFVTAIYLKLASLEASSLELLASEYARNLKWLNLTLYSFSISSICLYLYVRTTNQIASAGLFVTTALIYLTTPRLVNNYNNEALATVFFTFGSILLHEVFTRDGKLSYKERRLVLGMLGLALGGLALTKAQYIYIAALPILILIHRLRHEASICIIMFLIVISPWMYRNHVLFGNSAIADRGKTVAAVRLVLTSEPTEPERLCMAYAFTHPALREFMGRYVDIQSNDFLQGGKCQRLNRETCFDMASTKVKCRPFEEDLKTTDYSLKIQYFYMGFTAGQLIEKGHLNFSDLLKVNSDLMDKYVRTLPLFAWRGFAFTDFPLLSVAVSLSLFLLLFTRYWGFGLLAASSQLFHILLTHNIPRYHAAEYPIMAISAILLLCLPFDRRRTGAPRQARTE